MTDAAVFVLERLKYEALGQLEQRLETCLKDEFYGKILPKAKKELQNKLMVDFVNEDNSLEIHIKIKE